MHPDLYLVIHQQNERELTRDLELRRAALACSACIVRATRHASRLVAWLQSHAPSVTRRSSPAGPACCVA